MSQIAKNAGFNILATLVVSISGFLASIIAARILGPSTYGEFSFFLWIFTTLVLLVDLGVSSATAKFVAELEGAHRRFVANSLTLVLLTTQVVIGLVVGLLLAAFSPWLATFLNQPSASPYLAVLGVGVPVAMTLAVLRARLAGFQRYDLISLVSILSGVTTLAGTFLLLHYGLGVRSLIWMTVGIYGLQLVFFAALVWKQHNLWPLESIPFHLVRRVMLYCLGVFIWTSVDAIVWQRSETFFLGRYSTADQIGYYGLAYGIAAVLITTVPVAISGVLMPALSHHFGAGDRDAMQRIYSTVTKYLVIISLPLSLGGIAVAGTAVVLLYGADYAPMAWPLRILLIASAVGAMAGPGAALFLALGKPYLAGLLGIPIAILNLALAYALVPPYGAVGAALANAASQVLGVAVGTTYLLRYRHFRLPVSALLRTILAASLSAGLAYLITQRVTGWPGLLLAVILSAVVYVPALIFAGSLDSSDFQVLRGMTNVLPVRIGLSIKYLVDLMEAASLRWNEVFRTRTL